MYYTIYHSPELAKYSCSFDYSLMVKLSGGWLPCSKSSSADRVRRVDSLEGRGKGEEEEVGEGRCGGEKFTKCVW